MRPEFLSDALSLLPEDMIEETARCVKKQQPLRQTPMLRSVRQAPNMASDI